MATSETATSDAAPAESQPSDAQLAKDKAELERVVAHERRQRAESVKQVAELRKALEAADHKISELSATIEASVATTPDKEVAKLRKEFDEYKKALEQKNAEAEKRAADLLLRDQQRTISDALRTAALDVGVPKGAVEELIALEQFRKPWRVTEAGELAPFDEGGSEPWEDRSPKSYVQNYVKDRAHWLPPSSGSGAQGSAPPRTGSVMTVRKADVREASAWQKVQEEAAKRGAVVQYTE